jgi:hypothetical protein
MPDYRIFKLNAQGHVTGPALILTCEQDTDVIRKVESLVDGHEIEIWQGARIITRLRPGAAYTPQNGASPAPSTSNHHHRSKAL